MFAYKNLENVIMITAEDIDKILVDLNAISEWQEKLSLINTDKVEPTFNTIYSESNVTVNIPNNGDNLTNDYDVFTNAPNAIDNFFTVPKVKK